MKILIVDDEKTLADALKDNVEFEGYEADCAYGGKEALDYLKGDTYQLILLDVMMPDLDGFEVLTKLRKTDAHTPVIFLTARAEEKDKLKGLGSGADDYITKPFSVLELMARIKTVLKRTVPGAELALLHIGDATVDLKRFCITQGTEVTEIGRYEADLLRLLASEPQRVFTRDEILNEIWGMEAYPSNRTIDNYIVKLRQKIEPDPRNPQFIQSVYGKGYRLVLED